MRACLNSAAVSKAAKRERQRQNRAARKEYEEALDKRRKFWRSARTFGLILIPIVVLFAFFALRNNGGDDNVESSGNGKQTTSTTITPVTTVPPPANLPAPTGLAIDPNKTYTATIETNIGRIDIALDAKNAPNSVNNFVYLARAGFYNGLLFNRAAANFVVQTGGPNNTTAGGPGYTIQVELPQAAYDIGSVAWAKTGTDPAGSAGSQFFIGTGSNVKTLPKEYGYIGKVSSGLDVAERIMSFAPSSGDGTPTQQVQMTTVTITES
jgi:cyclophilin family peptidyl-prolyl cis-trans isomerase